MNIPHHCTRTAPTTFRISPSSFPIQTARISLICWELLQRYWPKSIFAAQNINYKNHLNAKNARIQGFYGRLFFYFPICDYIKDAGFIGMITLSLIQFNYSFAQFCVWVQLFYALHPNLHQNAPKRTACTKEKNPAGKPFRILRLYFV
jgi:hypothetical protein